jgi:hypothetical protein
MWQLFQVVPGRGVKVMLSKETSTQLVLKSKGQSAGKLDRWRTGGHPLAEQVRAAGKVFATEIDAKSWES